MKFYTWPQRAYEPITRYESRNQIWKCWGVEVMYTQKGCGVPGACVGLDAGNDGGGWGGGGGCGILARRRMLLMMTMMLLLLLEAAEAVTDGERFASTRTGTWGSPGGMETFSRLLACSVAVSRVLLRVLHYRPRSYFFVLVVDDGRSCRCTTGRRRGWGMELIHERSLRERAEARLTANYSVRKFIIKKKQKTPALFTLFLHRR